MFMASLAAARKSARQTLRVHQFVKYALLLTGRLQKAQRGGSPRGSSTISGRLAVLQDACGREGPGWVLVCPLLCNR